MWIHGRDLENSERYDRQRRRSSGIAIVYIHQIIILGEKNAEKLNSVFLSNNTVQRRIFEMSNDINCQVIEEINSFG